MIRMAIINRKIGDRRRYHLGLDWGTSATKLILRDYEQGKAFVIFPYGSKNSYRYPSTVVIADNRIYFGFEAENHRKNASKYFEALKAEIYQMTQDPGWSEQEDIATLYLAHIISIGVNFAEKHAVRGDANAVMGMTLGVPAEELDQSKLRDVYLRMARTAYEIAVQIGCDPQGEKQSDSCQALKYAREQIAKRDGQSPPDFTIYAQWLRPELAAAMYWGVKSPAIQCDIYSCIDIGAWTTNASYFRIHSTYEGEKSGITFYGGSCKPPGIIKLLKAVAHDLGRDFLLLVGKEEKYLSRKKFEKHIDIFRQKYFQVWQEGFRKSYIKERLQSAWDGKLNVMVVGGGSKVKRVQKLFYEKFPHHGWEAPKPVPDLGIPDDLYEFPSKGIIPQRKFSGDTTFLLVAYGLSVHSKDFPKTTLSLQVEPFKPAMRTKKYPSSEELGYDEK